MPAAPIDHILGRFKEQVPVPQVDAPYLNVRCFFPQLEDSNAKRRHEVGIMFRSRVAELSLKQTEARVLGDHVERLHDRSNLLT